MGNNKGHVAIRTCIACGSRARKGDLLRLTATEEGYVQRDPRGRGRGAYVCPEKACLEKASDRKRIARALRRRDVVQLDPALCAEYGIRPREQ